MLMYPIGVYMDDELGLRLNYKSLVWSSVLCRARQTGKSSYRHGSKVAVVSVKVF